MNYEVKLKIAPILNYFYEKYDVRSHENLMYRKNGTRSKNIVEAYKKGRDALVEYIENIDKPLSEVTKEEMMMVFEKAN